MKKQAVILFTATPQIDSERKAGNKAERKLLERTITQVIKRFCEYYQSDKYDFIIFSESLNAAPSAVKIYSQRGSTFGEKLTNCFSDAFNLGYESITVIGNDTFGITKERILRCFTEAGGHGAVVGPSVDGGIYLLTVTRSAFRLLNKERFAGIEFMKGKDFKIIFECFVFHGINTKVLKKMSDADDYAAYCNYQKRSCIALIYYSLQINSFMIFLLLLFIIKRFVISQRESYLVQFLKSPPAK